MKADIENTLSSEQLLAATGSLPSKKEKCKSMHPKESSPLKKRCIWEDEAKLAKPAAYIINMLPMPYKNSWPAKPDGPEPEPRMWKEPILTNVEHIENKQQDYQLDNLDLSDADDLEFQGIEDNDIDLEPMFLPGINQYNI